MIDISPELPEHSILAFVKEWMKLLADGRLEEACATLDGPNCWGISWTPSFIRETIGNTFSLDTAFEAVLQK